MATYDAIASYTLANSSSTSVTFNSISGYTDLVLVIHAKGTATAYPYLQFNSDTTANYYSHYLYGYTSGLTTAGTGFNAGGYSAQNQLYLSNSLGGMATTGFNWGSVTNIFQYTNGRYKATLTHAGTGNNSGGVEISTANWASTSAITSILVGIGSGAFSQGTVIALYGIYAG